MTGNDVLWLQEKLILLERIQLHEGIQKDLDVSTFPYIHWQFLIILRKIYFMKMYNFLVLLKLLSDNCVVLESISGSISLNASGNIPLHYYSFALLWFFWEWQFWYFLHIPSNRYPRYFIIVWDYLCFTTIYGYIPYAIGNSVCSLEDNFVVFDNC